MEEWIANNIGLLTGIFGTELVAVGIAAWWLDKRCERRIDDVKWMVAKIASTRAVEQD